MRISGRHYHHHHRRRRRRRHRDHLPVRKEKGHHNTDAACVLCVLNVCPSRTSVPRDTGISRQYLTNPIVCGKMVLHHAEPAHNDIRYYDDMRAEQHINPCVVSQGNCHQPPPVKERARAPAIVSTFVVLCGAVYHIITIAPSRVPEPRHLSAIVCICGAQAAAACVRTSRRCVSLCSPTPSVGRGQVCKRDQHGMIV